MSAQSVWAQPKADPIAARRAALQAAALHYLDSFNAVDGSLATRARCAQALEAYDRLCAEATERFT